MMKKIVLSILVLAAVVSLIVLAFGDSVHMAYYHSRERYTVCLRFAERRISILYDGGPEVAGPFQFSWKRIGAVLEAQRTKSWQYVEASVPAWFAACVLFVGPIPIALRGPYRRWRRRRQGQCLKCGYSLTGNTSGVCPECGTDVPA